MDVKALTNIKDQGNELFKQKKFQQSIQKFNACIQKIQSQQDKKFLQSSSQLSKLYVVCLINAALACINMKRIDKYQEAIKNCDKALSIDKQNIKGLYRRGLARKQMAEIQQTQKGQKSDGLLQIYQKAEKDFKDLCVYDKNNELATKNLATIAKDIYRVTIARGQKVALNAQKQANSGKREQKKGLEQQKHVQIRKKGKDMDKIMKQYKVQEVTSIVQQKVRTQYLQNALPPLRSQLQKAIRTLQKSQDVYIQFVYRLNEEYLTKIQPTFDILSNIANILIKKGQGQEAKRIFSALLKQKSWKLFWKSSTVQQKQVLKQKFKQLGFSQQTL